MNQFIRFMQNILLIHSWITVTILHCLKVNPYTVLTSLLTEVKTKTNQDCMNLKPAEWLSHQYWRFYWKLYKHIFKMITSEVTEIEISGNLSRTDKTQKAFYLVCQQSSATSKLKLQPYLSSTFTLCADKCKKSSQSLCMWKSTNKLK